MRRKPLRPIKDGLSLNYSMLDNIDVRHSKIKNNIKRNHKMALNNNRDRQRTRVVYVPVNTGGGGGSQAKIKVGENGIKLGNSTFTEIPQELDFSDVTDMSYMFYLCNNITTIPQIDTSSATNMVRMFQGCKRLTTISQIDTSSVEYTDSMFQNCSSLTSIPLIDATSLTEAISMFARCSSLTDLGGFAGLHAGIDLTVCPLTHDSIMNVINNAADVTGYGYLIRLELGSTNLAKITDEEKAIATNKGWTLV